MQFYILITLPIKNTPNKIFTNFVEWLCIFMYYYVEGGIQNDQMVQC